MIVILIVVLIIAIVVHIAVIVVIMHIVIVVAKNVDITQMIMVKMLKFFVIVIKLKENVFGVINL